MDFHFSYDKDRGLMTIIQKGYWSMDVFRAFEAEFLDWNRRVAAQHSEYRVLAECTEFKVQSTEVGEAFGALFQQFMAEFRGRYAVIVGSMMNKLQAARVLPYPNLRLFTNEERRQAMNWLFDESTPRPGGVQS